MFKADAARAAAVQPDGKLVVVGSAERNMTYDSIAIARYNRDGTPDSSFGFQGKTTLDFGNFERAQAVAVQPDGRILVAGYRAFGAGADFLACRLTPTGELDRTLGDSGAVTINFAMQNLCYDMALQADGKLVLAEQQRQPGHDVLRHRQACHPVRRRRAQE
jgi:uncharacterized delta-60 repeat protein